jgi:glycerol dehydrogenase-like iron-containing ADH family enzyme
MVAMGTLGQLMLEERVAEARRVADFFARVGLPVNLSQLSLSSSDSAALETVVEGTLSFPYIGNMQVDVTADSVRSALRAVDELGEEVSRVAGDAAYRILRA